MADHPKRRGMALHTKILLGLLLGAVAGVSANIYAHEAPALLWLVDNVAQPVGQIFLRLLFMVVVPLVFASVTTGVASLGDLRRIGRIGGKTLLIFLGTTSIAVIVGLTLVNLLSGAVVIEGIFFLPGLGERAVVATSDHNLPVITGIAFCFTLVVVTTNLLVDLAYRALNPRVRHS